MSDACSGGLLCLIAGPSAPLQHVPNLVQGMEAVIPITLLEYVTTYC